MMSREKTLCIEEISGEKYPDLIAAQRMALADFASCLVSVIQELIDHQELVIREGHIIPNPDTCIISQSSD